MSRYHLASAYGKPQKKEEAKKIQTVKWFLNKTSLDDLILLYKESFINVKTLHLNWQYYSHYQSAMSFIFIPCRHYFWEDRLCLFPLTWPKNVFLNNYMSTNGLCTSPKTGIKCNCFFKKINFFKCCHLFWLHLQCIKIILHPSINKSCVGITTNTIFLFWCSSSSVQWGHAVRGVGTSFDDSNQPLSNTSLLNISLTHRDRSKPRDSISK